jgi:hypothetical protein
LYWGIDRLHHLERRLQVFGAQRQGVSEVLIAPPADLVMPLAVHGAPDTHFFPSFRSPYSAIVAPRVFELGRLTDVARAELDRQSVVANGLKTSRVDKRNFSTGRMRPVRHRAHFRS